MKVIIGLGNPGKEYEGTRHNMGYMVVDKLAELLKVDIDRTDFNGVYTLAKNPFDDEKIIIGKPETFMNLSGKFVSELLSYFKISVEDLLVIYDDMDIEPGKIRIRKSGSPGTHNGMKSVIHCLQSDNFIRVRVGIGSPVEKSDLINYVIGPIEEENIDFNEKDNFEELK